MYVSISVSLRAIYFHYNDPHIIDRWIKSSIPFISVIRKGTTVPKYIICFTRLFELPLYIITQF